MQNCFKYLIIFSYVFAILSIISLIEASVLDRSEKYKNIIQIMYILFVMFAFFSLVCASVAHILQRYYLQQLVNIVQVRPNATPDIINILR